MKNNKVLMSLVVASISAMAAAPFVLEAEDNKNAHASDENTNGTSIADATNVESGDNVQIVQTQKNISIESILTATLMAGDDNIKIQKDLTDQTAAMLNKKDTLQPLYESISIIAENYGSSDSKVMKKEIYEEFNFGYTDSTASSGAGSAVYGKPATACHWACHSACHSACHGSRGWR